MLPGQLKLELHKDHAVNCETVLIPLIDITETKLFHNFRLEAARMEFPVHLNQELRRHFVAQSYSREVAKPHVIIRYGLVSQQKQWSWGVFTPSPLDMRELF
jgi:hypothetical protein